MHNIEETPEIIPTQEIIIKKNSKWAKAIAKADGTIDSTEKLAIGLLCGSKEDKAICLELLKKMPKEEIQKRSVTGHRANESRWASVGSIVFTLN